MDVLWIVVMHMLVAMLSTANGELKLMLLHTNDMHSRFLETDAHSGQCRKSGPCYGGFARVRGAVDRYRLEAVREGYNSVFLNAGDSYQGSTLFTFFKWQVVSELVNLLGIDVMSLGNHEFDDGPSGLAPFLVRSSTPIVCSNIDVSQDPVLKYPGNRTSLVPSKVLHIDGVKIGIIGYLTPETKFISNLGEAKLSDEVTAIAAEAQKLKKEGVNILIAVGHSGYSKDKEIAEKVPELDLVVGGHTNTFLYSGTAPDVEKPEGSYPTVVTQPSGRKVLVVQAYAYTKYLGVLKLKFNDNGEVTDYTGNPVLLDHTIQKNSAVDEAVAKYAGRVSESMHKKVGVTRAFLESDLPCRIKECNFGNLVTDALIYSNAKDYFGNGWTDAPIAFVQGGALRASISTVGTGGEIKYEDVLTLLPFTNSVEKATIKGSVLKEVLEHSVAGYSIIDRPGSFLQYSGIKVTYDVNKPPHQRVVSALVRCGNCSVPRYQPLDPNETYTIMTNTYLVNGGDSYLMLKTAEDRETLAMSDVDAVVEYIEKLSPLYPEESGRIEILGAKQNQIDLATISSPSSSHFIKISWTLLILTLITIQKL